MNAAKPDEARVHVRYRCSGIGVHLWASVKQDMIDPEADYPLGSRSSESWYETPEGPAPICDGEWHAQPITVILADGWEQLEAGEAYLQFVIFTADGGRGAVDGWQTVKATGRT